jgi:GTP cyclohydrolase I
VIIKEKKMPTSKPERKATKKIGASVRKAVKSSNEKFKKEGRQTTPKGVHKAQEDRQVKRLKAAGKSKKHITAAKGLY